MAPESILTDIAVSSRPLCLAITFSNLCIKPSMARAIWQTLEEGLIALLTVSAHPAQITLADTVLAGAVTRAASIVTVFCKKNWLGVITFYFLGGS